jgi:DNA (cytosine-5)-methyltransferase 1
VKPRLLDLFCGAGGAAVGYHRAGFDVVGVDIAPQPRYPFEFHQADALDYLVEHWREYDAIHASPPCQGYLNLRKVNHAQGRSDTHGQLIAATRGLLTLTHLPYVLENVSDARCHLIDPVRVCGTGLGLPLRRHRLFESNRPLRGVPCEHRRFTEPRYWTSWRPNGEHRLSTVVQVYGNAGGREHWPAAMGIDWMASAELVEAVPPAYTEHIGAQLIDHLGAAA